MDSRMQPEKSSQSVVSELIKAAFAGIEYPGDSSLVVPSRFEYDDERKESFEYFRGRHWLNCSVRDREYFHHTSWVVLTPAGYRYYLPSFMLASVLEYKEADLIPDTIVDSLIPPSNLANENEKNKFFERINGLSKEQLLAIRAFLEFLVSEHPDEFSSKGVRRAIEFYSR